MLYRQFLALAGLFEDVLDDGVGADLLGLALEVEDDPVPQRGLGYSANVVEGHIEAAVESPSLALPYPLYLRCLLPPASSVRGFSESTVVQGNQVQDDATREEPEPLPEIRSLGYARNDAAYL